MKYALWILQVVLALLFLFAGVVKLIMPYEAMAEGMPVPVPELLLRFIALAEVLGGLGLVLPGLLKVRPELTPMAAAGLVIIMIGATALSAPMGAGMIIPLAVLLLTAFVAYGRWRLVPLRGR